MSCCFLKEARTLSQCFVCKKSFNILPSPGQLPERSIRVMAMSLMGSETEVPSQSSTCGGEAGGHRWCELQAATVQLFRYATSLIHRGWTFFARFSGALWETFIDVPGSLRRSTQRFSEFRGSGSVYVLPPRSRLRVVLANRKGCELRVAHVI